MNYTADEIRDIVFEAKMIANATAKDYIKDKLTVSYTHLTLPTNACV